MSNERIDGAALPIGFLPWMALTLPLVIGVRLAAVLALTSLGVPQPSVANLSLALMGGAIGVAYGRFRERERWSTSLLQGLIYLLTIGVGAYAYDAFLA